MLRHVVLLLGATATLGIAAPAEAPAKTHDDGAPVAPQDWNDKWPYVICTAAGPQCMNVIGAEGLNVMVAAWCQWGWKEFPGGKWRFVLRLWGDPLFCLPGQDCEIGPVEYGPGHWEPPAQLYSGSGGDSRGDEGVYKVDAAGEVDGTVHAEWGGTRIAAKCVYR
ncbi:Uu.00g096400.m01.CDS01 [Anthostomella pinea]|uniref:Uu.00g096400.m01.CDS01 n=1 Tax=Anthostomella pinea TaxID=933095 RepID=A0AAI8YEU8_9PEZI|nr:Uu.00g096400.m01.CDS01 [Anthostomella pinea]